MLGWAFTFLILALVAGYMGFFGLAGLAATIAKLLLIVFVILLIVSAFSGALRGRPPICGFEGRDMRIPHRFMEHPIEAVDRRPAAVGRCCSARQISHRTRKQLGNRQRRTPVATAQKL